MGESEFTFAEARVRLEDIVAQVRKKDMSLESGLDLLEEGVCLANACTEQIDQSEWRSLAEEEVAESTAEVTAEDVVSASAAGDAGAPEPTGGGDVPEPSEDRAPEPDDDRETAAPGDDGAPEPAT